MKFAPIVIALIALNVTFAVTIATTQPAVIEPARPAIDPWPSGRKPDSMAIFRTKRGDVVSWESFGEAAPSLPDENGQPNKRFRRYPRTFKCTLSSNGDLDTGAVAHFDLYDIGAQRNRDDLFLVFIGTGATDIVVMDEVTRQPIQPDARGHYLIPAANWVGSRATRPVGLYFGGAEPCTFVIHREAVKRLIDGRVVAADDGDDTDGSPPPIDPGDDGSEEP